MYVIFIIVLIHSYLSAEVTPNLTSACQIECNFVAYKESLSYSALSSNILSDLDDEQLINSIIMKLNKATDTKVRVKAVDFSDIVSNLLDLTEALQTFTFNADTHVTTIRRIIYKCMLALAKLATDDATKAKQLLTQLQNDYDTHLVPKINTLEVLMKAMTELCTMADKIPLSQDKQQIMLNITTNLYGALKESSDNAYLPGSFSSSTTEENKCDAALVILKQLLHSPDGLCEAVTSEQARMLMACITAYEKSLKEAEKSIHHMEENIAYLQNHVFDLLQPKLYRKYSYHEDLQKLACKQTFVAELKLKYQRNRIPLNELGATIFHELGADIQQLLSSIMVSADEEHAKTVQMILQTYQITLNSAYSKLITAFADVAGYVDSDKVRPFRPICRYSQGDTGNSKELACLRKAICLSTGTSRQ